MTPFRFLVLVTVCLLWGLHFSVVKGAVTAVPPIFYAALRMGCVALLLFPLLRWHKGQMGLVLIAALGFGGLNYIFWFSGIQYTTVSYAAITLEAYVPFATILSIIFLRERIGLWRMTGLIFALTGIVVVILSGGKGGHAENVVLGAGLVLAGAFCEAAAAVAVRSIKGVSPFQLLAWFGVVGCLTAGVLTFIFEDGQMAVLTGDTRWPLIGALAYSVLVASLIGQSSYFWLLQRVEVSQVAGATVLTALFAVGFGVLLSDDPLTPLFVAGGITTLIGVWIIVTRNAKKQILSSEIASDPQHD